MRKSSAEKDRQGMMQYKSGTLVEDRDGTAGKQQPARVRAIVSDLGQVVLPFDIERAWSAVLPHCAAAPAEVRSRLGSLVKESRFGCGGLSGEEFHRCLVDRFGLRLPLPAFRDAWSDMFWEDPQVIRLIESAPVEQRVLLSNTNELHWDFIRGRFPQLLARFDHILVSHECGCEKPQSAIYRMVLAATGLRAGEHLLIDDIEDNVLGARAVGMEAVLHTDLAGLRREFRVRGLLPKGPPQRGRSAASDRGGPRARVALER